MSLGIELFRSDDYVRDGEIPLLPLLRGVFEPLIGEPLERVRFQLTFLPVADPYVLTGLPSVVNLRSSHGYVQVRITRDGQVLYRHPHPVREIVTRPLRDLLAERDPGETHWGFGISGPGLDRIALVRPAPEQLHSVNITGPLRKPRVFRLAEVEEPEPPLTSLAGLGADLPDDAVPDDPVQVVVDEEVLAAFRKTLPFSLEVEEGGFLAGNVFRAENPAGGHIVEVTAAIQAERTGASMFGFTFTGESFLRVSERIAARGRGERLLGWYHTHLFQASESLGLSSVDVDLHRSTFRRPWQVAALVNVTEDGRMLRFYRANGETMTIAPYWAVRR